MIPKVTLIESTNKCNLRCVMCARNHMTRKTGCMSLSLADKIMKQIPKGEFIWTHGWGEPLLHPEFDKFVKIGKRNGLRIGAITNGTLLDGQWIERIINSKLDILSISIDANTKAAYEDVRIGAKYETVFDNLKRLSILKKEKRADHLTVRLNIVDIGLPQNEITNLIESTKDQVDGIRVKVMNDYGRHIEGIKQPMLVKRNTVCRNLIHGGIIIYWNGEVGPCCTAYDGKVIYGDLNTHTLEEIWEGDIRKQFLADQKQGIFHPICEYCRIHETRSYSDVI